MAKYSSEGVERAIGACKSAGWSETLMIHSLTLSDSDMKLLVMEKGAHLLQRLKILDAANITDVALQYLGHLKSLRALSLGCVSITDDGLKHLSGLRELTWLALCTDAITDDGIEHVGKISKLDTLLLGGGELTGECCQYLDKLKSLSELEIGDMSMEISDDHFKYIGKLMGLRRLSLIDAQPLARYLGSLCELRLLESIQFSRCPWLRGITSLAPLLPPRGSLRELDVRDCPLPDDVRNLTDARRIIEAMSESSHSKPAAPMVEFAARPTLVVSQPLPASAVGDGEHSTPVEVTKKRNMDSTTRTTKIQRAIGYLMDNPDATDKEVAKHVPCAQSTLSSNDKYKRAREIIRSGRSLPRGTKFDGSVDGIAPDDDDE